MVTKRSIVALLLIGIGVLSIPLGLNLVQQQQNLRSEATGGENGLYRVRDDVNPFKTVAQMRVELSAAGWPGQDTRRPAREIFYLYERNGPAGRIMNCVVNKGNLDNMPAQIQTINPGDQVNVTIVQKWEDGNNQSCNEWYPNVKFTNRTNGRVFDHLCNSSNYEHRFDQNDGNTFPQSPDGTNWSTPGFAPLNQVSTCRVAVPEVGDYEVEIFYANRNDPNGACRTGGPVKAFCGFRAETQTAATNTPTPTVSPGNSPTATLSGDATGAVGQTLNYSSNIALSTGRTLRRGSLHVAKEANGLLQRITNCSSGVFDGTVWCKIGQATAGTTVSGSWTPNEVGTYKVITTVEDSTFSPGNLSSNGMCSSNPLAAYPYTAPDFGVFNYCGDAATKSVTVSAGAAATNTPTPTGATNPTATVTPPQATNTPPQATNTLAPQGGPTVRVYKISESSAASDPSASVWDLEEEHIFNTSERNRTGYKLKPRPCPTEPCDPYPREIRRIYVLFVAADGTKRVEFNDILVALKPVISSASCQISATGSGIAVRVNGLHFGNDPDRGSVLVGEKSVNLAAGSAGWSNLQLNGILNDNLSGSTDVVVITKEGKRSDPVACTVGQSQLDFKATLACRSVDKPVQEVNLEIKEKSLSVGVGQTANLATARGISVFKNEKLTLDDAGRPRGLFPSLTTGKVYQLIVKADNTLRKVFEFTAAEGTTAIEAVNLPAGDIAPERGDCVINNFDRSELLREWSAAKDVTKRGDLNLDGRINSIDYACMVSNFNKSCDNP